MEHLWYNSLGALELCNGRTSHCYLLAKSHHLWYNSRMAQNTTNDETTRTCNYCGHAPDLHLDPQFGACEECVDEVRAEACWARDSRYTQDSDDSDIDPPFDYSAPEDDSDRNGGSESSGYEPPEVQ